MKNVNLYIPFTNAFIGRAIVVDNFPNDVLNIDNTVFIPSQDVFKIVYALKDKIETDKNETSLDKIITLLEKQGKEYIEPKAQQTFYFELLYDSKRNDFKPLKYAFIAPKFIGQPIMLKQLKKEEM